MEVFYYDQLNVNAILSPKRTEALEVSLLGEHVVQSAPTLKNGLNVFQRMEARRNERYEEIKTRFRKDIHQIKINLNKQLHSLCVSLSADLEIIKEKLREKGYVEDKELEEMTCLWDSEVNDWRIGIDEVSKEMSAQCKKALRLFSDELTESKVYSIQKTQEEILQTILDINHIILNNVRVYEEVEAHLKSCGRTIINKHNIILKPEDDEEPTESTLTISTKEEVEEEEEEKKEEEVKIIYEPACNYWRAQLDIIQTSLQKELPTFSDERSTHKIILQHLDICIENTMAAYTTALNYVDEKMNEFTTMGTVQNMDFLEFDWNHILFNLEESVEQVVKLFRNTACTWFSYNQRSTTAAEAFERMIKNKRIAKDRELQTHELMINIALDEIRQSSNMEQIMKAVNQIEDLFKLIEEKTATLVDNEIKLSKEYLEARELAFDIFQTQASMFGEIVPMPVADIPSHGSDIDLSELLKNEIKGDVPEDFKHHMERGFNWKYGFTASFSVLKQDESQTLYNMCTYWENERKKDAQIFLARVKDRSARRRSRIVEDIIGVRLSELKAHESAYMRHASGIDTSIYNMVCLIYEIRKDFHTALKDVETLMASILDKECLENPTAKSIITMKQSKIMYEQLQKRFKYIVELQANAVDTETKWMEGRTVAFMKNMKLFSEGGNYSLDEVHTYKKKVQTLFGKLKSCKSDLSRGLSKVLNDYHTNVIHSNFELIDKSLITAHKTQKLKDEISEIDSKLKRSLRILISETKNDIKNLEEYMKNSESGDLWAWEETLYEMHARASFLEKPEDVSLEIEDLFEMDEEDEMEEFYNDVVDRRDELLDLLSEKSTESKEDSFIMEFKSLIANSMNQLQEKVKELISLDQNQKPKSKGLQRSSGKMGKVTREELTPLESEMVSKFLNYNVQCELIWLEMMYDLASLFSGIKDLYFEIAEKFLKECKFKWKTTLLYSWSVTKKKLRSTQSLEKEGRKKLEKMLKPSFGHPKNEPLCQALLNSVDAHIEEHLKIQQESLLEFKKTCQREMERFDMYTEDLQVRINNMAKAIVKSECMDIIVENMLDFLESYEEEIECLPIQINDPLTYNVTILASDPSQIMGAIAEVLDKWAEYYDTDSESQFEIDDYSQNISEIKQEIQAYVRNELVLYAYYIQVVHKDLQKWKERWRDDMENLNNLYATKSI